METSRNEIQEGQQSGGRPALTLFIKCFQVNDDARFCHQRPRYTVLAARLTVGYDFLTASSPDPIAHARSGTFRHVQGAVVAVCECVLSIHSLWSVTSGLWRRKKSSRTKETRKVGTEKKSAELAAGSVEDIIALSIDSDGPPRRDTKSSPERRWGVLDVSARTIKLSLVHGQLFRAVIFQIFPTGLA
jgi:hypothetical protein